MSEANLPAPMIMGVHGVLTLNPWVSPEHEDVFGLVVRRTVSYGWSSFHASGPDGVRWGHNEADGDWEQDQRVRQLAWLQVDVADAPRGQRLPVLPAATVLGDSLNRIGRFRFTGLHTVAPLYEAPDSRADLAYAAEWFALADPAASAEFTLSVASTKAADLPGHAPDILAAALERAHGQLGIEAAPLSSRQGLPASPAEAGLGLPLAGELETTHLQCGQAFRCVTREWSLDMAAWVTEIFIDALRGTGTTHPALITVSKPLSPA
ncbi:hypothetical protein HRW23_26480 [Streptomyces lunaelactis]|uniref:hypothetical protein n=1 Tax=Streptomyces lunaelactis TaxID=1535768 RepID=UPI0015858813|nr:hypothetical protein [Streptomyces lunaelactis]NUK25845.1 hypothetical protein [Streptomyces lunaelactis]NUK48895.1 hypothetical protein [Streptomyces lunaelactis]NUK64498.1 hypothetical protein [Streptomyces lunaelactis]NUK69484.1 hypothetical protein [Streptomyces lunaelactis]NUK80868.1 hypothetical protein [Streptomyces lunaelactis]